MTENTRREFIKQTAAGAAILACSPRSVLGANDHVRIGMIGIGARVDRTYSNSC
jgi:hypothetical protein